MRTLRTMLPGAKVAIMALLLAGAALPAAAQRADEGGVNVGRPSFARYLVSAEGIEKAAGQQFVSLKSQATGKRVLLPDSDEQTRRVRRIAKELLPFAEKWNPRAKDWTWEVIVIKAPTVNAFCMPGGKIAFFTGILDRLSLTDDEVAVVMGHEIAHALREHARSRKAKTVLTQLSAVAVSLLLGEGYGQIAQQGGGLLTLRFSRGDEREADLIGLELAARAGYNPEAGVALWQKMARAQKGAPPQWLSTHPSSEDRIARIRAALPKVAPLYDRARAGKG
ncbi:MAG: M48 family metallopeptidase [Hyphomicrobiaceae bacterium]|nr:M48 family metallopeptidase [Hyphomicrobiaceae bacterium]